MAVTLDNFYPFDSGAGANVAEDRWHQMAQFWLRSGPIPNELNEFAVYADSTGMQVKVRSGRCWIAGEYGDNAGVTILPINTYTVDRLDAVVLRTDFTSNNIVLDVLQGPGTLIAPPTLTQNSSIWEVLLAYVQVTTNVTIAANKVLDQRVFAGGVGGVKKTIAGITPSASTSGGPYAGQSLYESDTGFQRIYNGTKWCAFGARPMIAQGTRSSNLSVANGGTDWTVVTLTGSENFDTNAVHPASAGYMIAVEADLWRATGLIEYFANGTGDRGLGFHKASGAVYSSGVPSDVQDLRPAAGTTHRMSASKVFDCAANDWITLVGWQNSGGALNIIRAELTLERIGSK